MSVEIRPVATSEERRAFLRFPWKIYPSSYPAWVPPLLAEERKRIDPDVNPFFGHGSVELFLAYSNGDVAGRIAAVENTLHNEFHQEKIGFFGLFESVEDQEVANALFDSAAEWARDRGLIALRGPANFSTNEECGLLIDSFDDPPYVLMNYNPPYYVDLFENWGLAKAKDLLAYAVRHDGFDDRRFARISRLVERSQHDLRVRSLRMKQFDKEVELIRDLYNLAWERNWGFVPMTDAEVDYMAKALKPVVEPDLAMIGEIDGVPVGFALALPDINQALHHLNGRLLPFGIFKLLWYMRRINRMRIITLGIQEEHRRTGLDGLFYLKMFGNGRRLGIDFAESSWILEDNELMNRALVKMGFVLSKTYRMYERALEPRPTIS